MSSVEALATRVRVSVLTAGRRTDLAVPAGLPVAELAPALARACGLPEGSLGSGLTVAHADGRLLDPALDLDRAGVVDGDLLVLEAPAAIELPDDDLAAAVARVRGAVLTVEDGVRAAALAVPVLAGAAALALTRWRGGALVAAGLGVTAVALLVAVRALGRRRVAGSGEVVAGLAVAAVLVAALAGAVAAEAGVEAASSGIVFAAPPRLWMSVEPVRWRRNSSSRKAPPVATEKLSSRDTAPCTPCAVKAASPSTASPTWQMLA